MGSQLPGLQAAAANTRTRVSASRDAGKGEPAARGLAHRKQASPGPAPTSETHPGRRSRRTTRDTYEGLQQHPVCSVRAPSRGTGGRPAAHDAGGLGSSAVSSGRPEVGRQRRRTVTHGVAGDRGTGRRPREEWGSQSSEQRTERHRLPAQTEVHGYVAGVWKGQPVMEKVRGAGMG